MFRFILFALLAVILISLLRTIIGVVMKGLGDFAGGPNRRHKEALRAKLRPARRGSSSRPSLRNVCRGIDTLSTSNSKPGVLLLLRCLPREARAGCQVTLPLRVSKWSPYVFCHPGVLASRIGCELAGDPTILITVCQRSRRLRRARSHFWPI